MAALGAGVIDLPVTMHGIVKLPDFTIPYPDTRRPLSLPSNLNGS